MKRRPAATTYTPLEREVQRSAIKILCGLGWTVRRRNTGGMRWRKKDGTEGYVAFGSAGMSDLWGTMPDGRRFELEIKRPNKRPTAKQLEWLRGENGPHCCSFWIDNTETLHSVALALMRGGHIWWHEVGDDYDVDFDL